MALAIESLCFSPPENLAPRKPITERPTEQDERAHRQQISVHRPLQTGDAQMQVACDRRERNIRHATFDEHRARSENRADQRPALSRSGHLDSCFVMDSAMYLAPESE